MIVLTALRFVCALWIEARELQREAHKRFPHMRSDW